MSGGVLEFLPNEAGENEGLGDAGIETFRDNPYASCGREAGQNSRDAEAGFPVRLTFDVLDIDTEEFPGIEVLRETIASCLDAAKQEKDLDFFKQAAKLVVEPTLKVLRIADHNTKGLAGPSGQEGTPFHSLLKGSGVSNDKTETSGGSFGIGKNASFAVSDLQTVFYSTRYGEQKAFAAQGKSRMVSHVDANGNKRRATGYWGNSDGYTAVEDPADVPAWMRRDDVGTSIFCAGFRQQKGWAQSIAYSLLINFFAAIQRQEMAFEIDEGAIRLNHNTIAAMFADPVILQSANEDGQANLLSFSADLYRCLISPEAKVIEMEVAGLGLMRFRILVGENLPKKVGIIRNGMLITSELQQFGDQLQRFVGTREFVALVEPLANEASKLMKSIENPRHDSFSANRLADPEKRMTAELAMKQLIRDLRKVINEAAAVVEDAEVTIDELSRYFAEQASGATPPDPNAENDPEKYTYKPVKRAKTSVKRMQPDAGEEGGGGSETTDTGGGPRHGDEPGPGAGTGGTGTSGKVPPLRLKGVRNIPGSSPLQRTVWFTPTVGGQATVQIEATGLNSGEPLDVVDTSEGKISKGAVVLDLVEGERTRLDVTFDAEYTGPVEVFAVLQQQEKAA